MNTKMKLMGAGLSLAMLLGTALATGSAAAATTGTGTGTTTGPVVNPGFYQGWYSQYIVIWNGGQDQGSYQIQIQTTYISGASQYECALALSNAMSKVKVYQWASCVQML